MNELTNFIAQYLYLFLLFLVVFYIFQGYVVYKLHYAMYGRPTIKGWIPILNIYTLFSLTVGKTMAILLMIMSAITIEIPVIENGATVNYSLLPSEMNFYIVAIYNIISVILFFYAIIKYFILKSKPQESIQGFYPKYENYSKPNYAIPQPTYQNQPTIPQQNINQTTHQQMYQNNSQQFMNQSMNQNNPQQFVNQPMNQNNSQQFVNQPMNQNNPQQFMNQSNNGSN